MINIKTSFYRGRIVKGIRVLTDNTSRGVLTVYLSANVVALADSTYPVVVDPWHICVAQADTFAPEDVGFAITNVSEFPVNLRGVSLSDECVQFDLPREIAPGESAVGAASLNRTSCEQTFHASLTFETDDPESTRFTIPVEWVPTCAGAAGGGDKNACATGVVAAARNSR